MSNPALSVKVTGLEEVRAALGALGPAADKLIRTRLLGVAGTIAGTIRQSIPVLTGAAAGSVKAGMDQKGAWVSEGAGIPYMPWLDFGGSTGRGHQRGPNMGMIHRTWMGRGVGDGRYIYPAIMAKQPVTLKAIDDAIAEAAKELDFDTDGDGTKP